MPRNESIIGVFVASPSDVAEERKALESIAYELNKTWSKNLNLRLDLIKWETDTYPGFGDYSQDVINKQITDEYDVFIAIFWSKIGSPTQIADSGTMEEFDRAYQKFKENKSSIDILVYFKDQAIPPSKMDFEQLQKLHELKTRLGEKGGLYWTFDSTEDFESLLRGHLSKIAQKWSSKALANLTQKPDLPSAPESGKERNEEVTTNEDEEYGLFDYLEIYEDRMSAMTASLSSIAEATQTIGNQFNRRTEEINSAKNKHGQSDVKQARKIIKLSSDDMERYSEIIESQIKIASKSREEAFDVLSKALSVYVDFITTDGTNNFTELKESLENMRDAASGTNTRLSEFRKTVSNLPRLTIQLNKSKRRTVRALDAVLEEGTTTVQSTINVIGIIDEINNGQKI